MEIPNRLIQSVIESEKDELINLCGGISVISMDGNLEPADFTPEEVELLTYMAFEVYGTSLPARDLERRVWEKRFSTEDQKVRSTEGRILTEKFVSVLPSLFGHRPKRKTSEFFEFCVLQECKGLQVWLQCFNQTVNHCARSGFAWCPALVDLLQLFCVPNGFIYKRTEDLIHIRPVLVVDAQAPCFQAFREFRPVFIPMQVCLQEREMEQEPKLDALVRPDGVVMCFLCTGVFAERGCLVKVLPGEVILVIHQPDMLVDIIAVGNILHRPVEQADGIVSFAGDVQVDAVTVFCIDGLFDGLKILRLRFGSLRHNQVILRGDDLTKFPSWFHPGLSHVGFFGRLHAHGYTSQLNMLWR